MAHFAELDENNIVKQVIVVSNECLDPSNEESSGVTFCQSLLGGIWKQTSYNGNFRKNFAGIGYTYDEERDAFIPVKPYNSWVLDENTCQWEPPIPRPDSDNYYIWNEEDYSWDLLQ